MPLAKPKAKWDTVTVPKRTKELLDLTAREMGWRRSEIIDFAVAIFREAHKGLIEQSRRAREGGAA